MPIPTDYQTVTPYLIVSDGTAFLTFLQELFNAEVIRNVLTEDNAIRHAEVKIGNASIMFGTATDDWQPLNSSLFIYVENADTTYAKALELGCSTIMELSNQDYGRTCGVKDAFGNIWWITSV